MSAAFSLILPEMLPIITPPPIAGTGPPVLEIAELIEARASGREKHGVPRLGLACRRANRAFQGFALCHSHVRRQERSEQFACLANGIGLAHVVEVRGAFVEFVSLRLPTADPADALERSERRRGRGRAGRL